METTKAKKESTVLDTYLIPAKNGKNAVVIEATTAKEAVKKYAEMQKKD